MRKNSWLILVAIVFSFSIANVSLAEVVSTAIFDLDKPTLVRGITAESSDGDVRVAIAPKQFSNRVVAKISKINDDEIYPAGMSAVSSVYLLDIKTGLKGFLQKAVTLNFAVDNLLSAKKSTIYYYDNNKKSWLPLPTNIICDKGLVETKTIFPYIKIVVLDETPVVQPFGNLGDDVLTAQSAMVVDTATGGIFYKKNVDEVRSIASLIKLAVALTFLDHNPGWDKIVTMQKDDFVGGATLYVQIGDQLTVKDLFYAMLIGSKNNATRALMRSTGYTEADFLQLMNDKAKSLGLENTHFVEPTGLNKYNVSTANEYLKIAEEAFKNPIVLAATTTKAYRIRPINSRLSYLVESTSKKVLNQDLNITGTKTGWTDEAGYCLVTQARSGARQVIALVMGAKITKNYEEVYSLLKKYL